MSNSGRKRQKVDKLDRACTHKRTFITKASAMAWADRYGRRSSGAPLRPYVCEYCDDYHLAR